MNDNIDKKQQPANSTDKPQKKVPAENETDTAPDEFIGPNADTDQPIDGQVTNDAVLRGEPSAHDRHPDEPSEEDAPKMKDGK